MKRKRLTFETAEIGKIYHSSSNEWETEYTIIAKFKTVCTVTCKDYLGKELHTFVGCRYSMFYANPIIKENEQ